MGKGYKIRRYGYGRGQERKYRIKRILVAAAIVLAVCAAGWFLFEPISGWFHSMAVAQQQRQAEKQAAAQQEQQGGEQTAGETQNQDAAAFPKKSITLATSQLYDAAGLASALKNLAAQGYDGAVFDLKDADGQVLYKSALETVTGNSKQVANRYDLAAVIKSIQDAGMTPVGRLYAFKDKTAGKVMADAVVKYQDTDMNWVDNSPDAGGKTWLNPNNTQAQEYILSLMKEAAGAGLKQVVLDGVQFPEGYSLEAASYAPGGAAVDKSSVLADFFQKAQSAASEARCSVWPCVNVSATAGVNTIRYGENLTKVLSAAGRVVLDVAPEQFGNGVQSDRLNLTAPVKDPYNTVKSALAASSALKDSGAVLAARVQGYASRGVSTENNLAYAENEINAQIKATQEFGINYVIVNTVG